MVCTRIFLYKARLRNWKGLPFWAHACFYNIHKRECICDKGTFPPTWVLEGWFGWEKTLCLCSIWKIMTMTIIKVMLDVLHHSLNRFFLLFIIFWHEWNCWFENLTQAHKFQEYKILLQIWFSTNRLCKTSIFFF